MRLYIIGERVVKKICVFGIIAVMLGILSCCTSTDTEEVEIDSSQVNIYKVNYVDFPPEDTWRYAICSDMRI